MTLVSPQILIRICQGLLTQDRSGSVNLAHSSIKEFLASEWIRQSKVQYFSMDPSSADRSMMRLCLTYLCLENFQSGYLTSKQSSKQRMQSHPLLVYAGQFWAIHANTFTLDDTDRHFITRLFNSRRLPQRGNYGVWLQTLVPEVGTNTIDSTQPLYYAASFGLVPIVKAILDSDPEVDMNARGGRYGSTPLFVACWRRNYEVVEILLKHGADPRIPDSGTGHTIFSLFNTLERRFEREVQVGQREAIKRLRTVAQEAIARF